MTQAPRDPLYRRHRFPAEVIAQSVWLYLRFPLSLRMVEYAALLTSTLWPSQNAVKLNLWCKPEVCDAIRDFITGGF